MTSNRSHDDRRWRDRGVVALEAAFALPVFLFLIFGMIDFGYMAFLDSQASSAARDGARLAILDPGTAQTDAIRAEVRSKLVGLKPNSITITCFRGLSGEAAANQISCDDAEPNADRVRVEVADAYDAITPTGALMFGTKTIRARATMVITGLPVGFSTPPTTTTTTTTTTTPGPTSSTTTTTTTTTTTAPPGACAIASVLPDSPISFGNGSNSDNYTNQNSGTTIRVTATNDACTSLRIRFPHNAPPGYVEVPLAPTGVPRQFSAPLGFRQYSVAVGTHNVRVVNALGVVLDDALTITRTS